MRATLSLALLLLSVFILQHKYAQPVVSADKLSFIARDRESAQFRDRLRRGLNEDFPWPGLEAMQVSWTWLELLQSLHVEASYEGDFSWMFSKLYSVAQKSNPNELAFLSSLASFYYVIGQDHVGANLLLEELYRRAPHHYNVNFWGGFHAMENLFHRRMAAYFYAQAARSPLAPAYLASLSLRLEHGEEIFLDEEQRREVLERHTEPFLLERLKELRPEWF